MTVESITLEGGKYELRYENGVIRPFRNGEYWVGRGDIVDKLVASMFCRIKRLESVVSEVHSWAVCAPIATPEDMMGGIGRVVQITSPDWNGDLTDEESVNPPSPQ